jgi:Ca-activated chloride channel family protein
MTFIYPQVLWLLAGLPLIGMLLLFGAHRSRKIVGLFGGERRQSTVLNVLTVKTFVSGVLFGGVLGSLVLALAGPQWGNVSVEDERRGLDIVYLMDVSNSMVAEDIPPSRLSRSREVARSVAGRLSGEHHAVVAFKGAATVVVPMTEDPVAFDLAIGNLSGALITSAGTSVQSGISTALDAFSPGSPRHRAILLFSDGEELQDAVEEELERIRLGGIPVFAVVSGTRNGATIPTRNGDLLRDDAGQPVIVRADRRILERIADVSGGGLYELSDTNVAQQIASDLEALSGIGRDVVFREVSVDRYHVFVLIALILMAGIILVQNVRWRDTL